MEYDPKVFILLDKNKINTTFRLDEQLSRTNNSLEGWHLAWSKYFRCYHPTVSEFVRSCETEDSMWSDNVAEYYRHPGDGIRGRGVNRRQTYVNNENNLRGFYHEYAARKSNPRNYLRLMAHHLPE